MDANWFLQHIPNFIDIDERPNKIQFQTTEELLNLEVVARYKRTNFSHFAIRDNCLMVISASGLHWWVVGYIGDTSSVDLPQWDGGKYQAILNDGTTVELSGKDVISSCGDRLTLKDGTTAKNLRF